MPATSVSLETAVIVALIAALLGSGGILSVLLGQFRPLIQSLQEDNTALRQELRLTKNEAKRANRRIDHFLRAVRSCPQGATCPVLTVEDSDVEDESEEERAPVRAGMIPFRH